MYSSITSIQVQPDKLDEFIRVYAEITPGAVQETDGLRSVQLLTDRLAGKILLIGHWETEAAARAWETNTWAQATLERLQPMLATPLQLSREYYDISFEHKWI